MKSIKQFYRHCNYLSLDVACGAIVCASFFAHILNVKILPYGLASLGLTVWIIYTTDHLLDAKKLKHQASSQRHRFHQNNFNKLLVVLVIAVLLVILLVFFIRKPILTWGIGLSAVVLLYLILQRRLLVFKELVAALLYSAGILLPALSLTAKTISTAEAILIGTFTLTAFINLLLFSWYDWEQDLTDNHFSLVTKLGRSQVKNILVVLFLAQTALFIVLILQYSYQAEALILAAMNIPLLILLLFPAKFSDNSRYRLIGDIVFIFPILYLL